MDWVIAVDWAVLAVDQGNHWVWVMAKLKKFEHKIPINWIVVSNNNIQSILASLALLVTDKEESLSELCAIY